MDEAVASSELGVSHTSFTNTESEMSESVVAASTNYIGKWNRLVSTTNWEKGAIISQWRSDLQEQGLSASQFSDEAWAKLVGGVTGQHAGRLRRVYQRFGNVGEQFPKLWDDAEMWLEGAVQNVWSVNEMRRQRWETLGSIPSDLPVEADIVATETDEDSEISTPFASGHFDEESAGPRPEGPDFGDEGELAPEKISTVVATEQAKPQALIANEVATIRPFENLPELPEDVAEAFEQFKLVVLRHKSAGWEKISRDDMLSTLESLKLLATAPTDNEAPW
jgi:hypothetical protein